MKSESEMGEELSNIPDEVYVAWVVLLLSALPLAYKLNSLLDWVLKG